VICTDRYNLVGSDQTAIVCKTSEATTSSNWRSIMGTQSDRRFNHGGIVRSRRFSTQPSFAVSHYVRVSLSLSLCLSSSSRSLVVAPIFHHVVLNHFSHTSMTGEIIPIHNFEIISAHGIRFLNVRQTSNGKHQTVSLHLSRSICSRP